ncbi:exopolysaccharide biosynthesis protein [Billgrantia lactosivorans]|uniref:exopolysaccharide biosynthesis protein n=1 Tax=Billgrantia lactosivorans TaxID=2185141 RepID=UPI000DADE6B5|nr:exopolysaccharide biosynthesis protein [Halomonas lactosivorans]
MSQTTAGDDEPRNLEQMLDRFARAERDERTGKVTLGDVLNEVGRRSFAPLLLVPGIITLLPVVGDIPGVPTLMALLVLLVAVQLLFRAQHFWIPRFLLQRSISKEKLDKAIRWSRRPARFVDNLIKPRLTFLTQGAGIVAVALACIAIALAMPPMEVVPFTANGAGLALTMFGLSLMSHDGLLAALAFTLTLATLFFVYSGFA